MVARACPGVFHGERCECSGELRECTAEHYIRYHFPQERGWAYVHMQMLDDGTPTLWPRREDNKDGRLWNRIVSWFRSRRPSAL